MLCPGPRSVLPPVTPCLCSSPLHPASDVGLACSWSTVIGDEQVHKCVPISGGLLAEPHCGRDGLISTPVFSLLCGPKVLRH